MKQDASLDWTDAALRSPHAAADKALRVRRMFNAIAPTYELVNALFSLGRDAYWRRAAVKLAGVSPGQAVLDVACGTGNFARAFAAGPVRPGRIIGCDYARGMLSRAVGRDDGAIRWCEADALKLPFLSETHDVVCCAFGVRNFQDLLAGLLEMYRVLRPGGRSVILEFSMPARPLLRWLYKLYFYRLMPRLAAWISGDRTGAYRYLPGSVLSFHRADEMCKYLARAGFGRTVIRPLTLGIVTVIVASKE